jgi:serine-type D-Ala-D-Ala carboxypeptidase (penicillin-binding protein 5/6)
VIAVDLYNKKIHVEAGADVKRPVGGLTMIATALVALDWVDATHSNLSAVASVPVAALQIAGQNVLGLQPGDQITLRDLIFASMMASDNVSATTLAGYVGQDILARRRKSGDPIAAFVDEMNKLAAREGMKRTKFTNPHGLENSKSLPYSSAADMAKLTMYALSRAPFRFYTNQKTRDIRVMRGGQAVTIPLRNTNALLGKGTIDGVKTGNTARSGGCIVLSEEHPGTVMKQQDGTSSVFRHRMVVVILGSGDPFAEGSTILEQGWHVYENWLQSGRPVTDQKQLLPTFSE